MWNKEKMPRYPVEFLKQIKPGLPGWWACAQQVWMVWFGLVYMVCAIWYVPKCFLYTQE